MTRLVVDASVAIKWVIEEDGSVEAVRLSAGKVMLTAPAIILAEVGNALWKRSRRGQITAAECNLGLDIVRRLVSETVDLAELVSDALHLASSLDQPIYDCFYLALARRDGGVLATADKRLAALARNLRLDLAFVAGAG